MNVFVQKRNTITGSNDWVVQNENYDYHQEVARSSFADMLHDTERNKLYEAGLKKAIDKMHQDGKLAKVLDIGTGTGLLSMMAVRNGADEVIACEAFEPMSQCALKIIEVNGFKDKIKVIPKRSTELVVGEKGDLPTRFNILVTEVFDTELIGEGALSTFKHAHEVLLEKDCIVVPDSATVYIQIVECPLVSQWNRVKNLMDEHNCIIKVPDVVKQCSGCSAVHDIQLSQLPIETIKTIVSPSPIFHFDWSGKTSLEFNRSTTHSFKSKVQGEVQAIFMWWELKMDQENELILSCAPFWAHPVYKSKNNLKIPWRDHWMQAVYYFPKEVMVDEGEEIRLISCHDEYSLWFNIQKRSELEPRNCVHPICNCGLHLFPRSRIGQINDVNQRGVLLNAMKNNMMKKNVLIMSNGFYWSLAVSKFNANKIYILENNPFSKRVMLDFIKFNNLDNIVLLEDFEELISEIPENSVDVVLAEPYFVTSILPWDNLFFYYNLRKVRKLLKENVQIFPKIANIKAVAVRFHDLHKIRTPLKVCEGFKMANFDELIEESSNISDDLVEAQPLWEYPGVALGQVVDLLTIDFKENESEVLENAGIFNIECSDRTCNGIAIWVDWQHGDSSNDVISSGPVKKPEIGNKISWDMNSRQGVCLFEDRNVEFLKYNFKLDLINGTATFEYI